MSKSKEKLIRVSNETHQTLLSLGKKGESFDQLINKILEEYAAWNRFKESFIRDIIFIADEAPDGTVTYKDLKESLQRFFGEWTLEKMK